jgi:acetylornithine deacetylase/succinyl-diaminopimelate desuccinylase-like protein
MKIIQRTYHTALLAFLLVACSGEESDSTSTHTLTSSAIDSQMPGFLPHQQLAREFLRELIEIDTTQGTGNTTTAADAMAAHLAAEGFAAEDVRVIGPTDARGNLVVRYRGRNTGRKPVLLLAHLDVVDADPADWTLDPFTFTEKDGYYYGRGATDDKDEAAIHIANLIRLKREGFRPDRDIIVALTADEEAGEANGVLWLLENHPDLIDAEFALNEGGGGSTRDGIHISNNVQLSEKIYQSYTLEVTNPGGHSSRPTRENAIYQLADALIRIRAYDFPVVLNDGTRVFFERSAEIEEGDLADAMTGVAQHPPDPAAIAYLSRIPFYNARLRTTCVATMLKGGHAENALPQRAQAIVNCRVLPGESVDAVLNTLHNITGDEAVTITPIYEDSPSAPSPLKPELLTAIEAVTEEIWPGVPVIPTMSTGATDGLYLRNAGTPVYGVSGILSEITDNRAHGRDERILIESFFEGQEFLYRLTNRISKSDVK